MKHRTLTLLGAAAFLVNGLNAQAPRIVVQGNGAPQVFTDLTAAVTAAQSDDKLYLSGGVFTVAGSLVIDKPLHLIGAGLFPDSAAATATTYIGIGDNLIFTSAASGSSFTGIAFYPGGATGLGTSVDDDDPTGLVFQRCEFQRGAINLGGYGGSTATATFDECIFRSTGTNQEFNGGLGAVVMTRCIFYKTVSGFSNLLLKNSVLLNSRLQNSGNCIVQNCVFTYNGEPLWQVSGVTVSNCLLTGTGMFSNSNTSSEVNTIFGQAAASIFVNETDGNYQFEDDLHLAAGSPGLGAGNDGTDIGIYGTSSPYKPGNVPYNPHFRSAVIAPATQPNGDLPVNIRVAAQPN